MLSAPGARDRQSPFDEPLVNKEAVANFLSMSEAGFTKLLHRGDGPPFLRIGRQIRFAPSVVKAWASAQTEIAAPRAVCPP